MRFGWPSPPMQLPLPLPLPLSLTHPLPPPSIEQLPLARLWDAGAVQERGVEGRLVGVEEVTRPRKRSGALPEGSNGNELPVLASMVASVVVPAAVPVVAPVSRSTSRPKARSRSRSRSRGRCELP